MTNEHYAALTAINKFFYYAMNYGHSDVQIGENRFTTAPEFFKAFPMHLRQHLIEKFDDVYCTNGANGAMIAFYGELDSINRRLLLDWILDNYKISDTFGICLKDEMGA